MKLHGQFGRNTDDKKSGKSWHWLTNGNLKRETESLLSAAHEQALKTTSVRMSNIMRMSQINVGNTCRECSAHSELLQYVSTKTHWAL